ncbi:MAG: polysaccharide deacetylase family protein [Bacteroidota bacterium]|nr:polysaccharide deacetylase family protein [Bacteroidota bacterium]
MFGKKNQVHITIDDGPSLQYTATLAGILKAHKAQATFFVLGENMEKWSAQSKVLQDFQLGNHGYKHINNWRTSPGKQIENIKRVEENFPEIEKYYRPPYGFLTISQLLYCYGRLTIKAWSLMTHDFNHYKTQDALWKRIQSSLRKNRCVLVFHDNIKSSKHTRWLLNRTLLEVKRLSKETVKYS